MNNQQKSSLLYSTDSDDAYHRRSESTLGPKHPEAAGVDRSSIPKLYIS